MKRKGNLTGEFVSFQNLYQAYVKARRGCRTNHDLSCFSFFFEQELLTLQHELITGTYLPGNFRYFQVTDPKKRTIAVAPFRDRVVHHALVNILEPVFEPTFIFHSYATRKQKGAHLAITQAQQYMKYDHWFLKMDIEKYFDSVDHAILKKLMRKKIKDDPLLQVIDRIIDNGSPNAKGLPIGNLTSQFMANIYLNPLDHFVKEQLRIRAYLRYMDDFVLFSNDKQELKSNLKRIREYLSDNLMLKIKEPNTLLNSRLNGLSFLGSRIFPSLIRIHPVPMRRCLQKLRIRTTQYKRGLLDERSFTSYLQSTTAHIKFFDTHQLTLKMIGGIA